jgi:chaperonin GroEL
MSDNNNKYTSVLFADEATKRLKRGLDIAAAAVGSTMGPKGKCVVIQRGDEAPIVTKDGVTVSKSIRLKDPVERIGANLLKEAASRTNDAAGDGTTTATVLTAALTTEGLKATASGRDRVAVRRGMQAAVEHVIETLRGVAKPVVKKEEVVQIGTISANGDVAIGTMIADAMERVGNDGVVTVEEATGMTTTCDIVEGMMIERGYVSPMFTTNSEKMTAIHSDCLVLVTDRKLSSIRDMIPLLEAVQRASKPLLIIADEIEGDALHGLIVNRLQGALKVVAIKAPGFGSVREELLGDICILTGARLVSDRTGLSVDKITLKDLGKAKKVTVDGRSTVIVGTGDTAEAVLKRASDLRNQMEDARLSDDERLILRKRLAKLASGVAVIRVGGSTEVEMKERKYRVEDALAATQSAIEEGILPGGGMALYKSRDVLNDLLGKNGKDYDAGIEAVQAACLAPLSTICHNAGTSFDVVTERFKGLTTRVGDIGWDAANECIVNMFEAGIIDPLKVCRIALENACSVAVTFLSLDAVVVEE